MQNIPQNSNSKKNVSKTAYGSIIAIVVLVLLIAIVWYVKTGGMGNHSASSNASSTAEVLQATVLHSDEYNFDVTAPAGTVPSASFKTFYEISNLWRANAPTEGPGSKGVAVVSIPIFYIDQNATTSPNGSPAEISPSKTYPIYFDAEVRIGVSSSTADCYDTDEGYTTQVPKTVTINGVTFKDFSFSDAAMMQYVQGESYRTIHDGLCYAIEQIKTGSSYRDSTMKDGFTDAELEAYYQKAGDVIQTFKFTK